MTDTAGNPVAPERHLRHKAQISQASDNDLPIELAADEVVLEGWQFGAQRDHRGPTTWGVTLII